MLVNPQVDPVAKIKVVGLGGGGGNAIDTMIKDFDIDGVDFMAFNTDQQALKKSQAPITLQMGEELTRGLGVGGNHLLGAQAAEESLDEISEYLTGGDMIFLTAGMGGGTGTGSIPVVAGVSKNLGALTVAVVTTPFRFEGNRRNGVAQEGIEALKDKVDTLIVVPNQRLLDIIDNDISFLDAMKKVDNVLAEGVKSITSLVTQTGFINVDFADVKSIMEDAGTSLMGIGKSKGENRAEDAARMATTSPLLNMSIEGAQGVLFNIIGGSNMTMNEIDVAAELIADAVDLEANIIFGATIDESLTDELVITIVATGFDETKQLYAQRGGKKSEESSKSEKKKKSSRGVSSMSMEDFDLSSDSDEEESSRPSKLVTSSSKSSTGTIDKEDIDDMDEKDKLDIPAFLRRK